MKKLVITLLFCGFSLIHCSDDGKATVKILLTGVTAESSQVVNVAVFNTLYTSQALVEVTYGVMAEELEIKIKEGANRMFVLAIMDEDGNITQSGSSGPHQVFGNYYLQATLTTVSLNLTRQIVTAPYSWQWSLIDGASKYELAYSDTSGGPYDQDPVEWQYNEYPLTPGDDKYYAVRAYFFAFDAYTGFSNEIRNTIF